MNELVCLDMPLSTGFVDRLKKAWDDGDAVFPLDRRLPGPARTSLVTAMRPTVMATEQGDARIDGDPVEPGDAIVVATSGSTGEPKGAVLTMDAVTASARAVHERLAVSPADGWFACLPPSHVGGLSVIMRSIITGTKLAVAPSFSVPSYLDAARNGSTLVSLVTTALARVDPSLYRVIVLGGSKPPADRPANCVATYGMTETGSGVVYDGIPLRGVEIDVRGGIIHLRAPMLMRAYRNATAPIGADGWFRTGDIGSFDAGVLRVEGREGDLIITGGENVWPETVEAAILTMPTVTDVCVAGVADREWGQAVHAFIVSGEPPALGEIRDHVKQSLPAHCAPKHVHVVEAIPRTALGKPQRSVLASSISG